MVVMEVGKGVGTGGVVRALFQHLGVEDCLVVLIQVGVAWRAVETGGEEVGMGGAVSLLPEYLEVVKDWQLAQVVGA